MARLKTAGHAERRAPESDAPAIPWGLSVGGYEILLQALYDLPPPRLALFDAESEVAE